MRGDSKLRAHRIAIVIPGLENVALGAIPTGGRWIMALIGTGNALLGLSMFYGLAKQHRWPMELARHSFGLIGLALRRDQDEMHVIHRGYTIALVSTLGGGSFVVLALLL